VGLGLHALVDFENLAVLADVERYASRWLGPVANTEGNCIFLGRVAEDRIVEIERLGERSVPLLAFDRVDTGGEVSDFIGLQILAELAHRLALFRAAAGERAREPGNHNRRLSLELVERVSLAVAANHLERRRRIAGLQIGGRSNRGGGGNAQQGAEQKQILHGVSTPKGGIQQVGQTAVRLTRGPGGVQKVVLS